LKGIPASGGPVRHRVVAPMQHLLAASAPAGAPNEISYAQKSGGVNMVVHKNTRT
jgi:hypothetical protein